MSFFQGPGFLPALAVCVGLNIFSVSLWNAALGHAAGFIPGFICAIPIGYLSAWVYGQFD